MKSLFEGRGCDPECASRCAQVRPSEPTLVDTLPHPLHAGRQGLANARRFGGRRTCFLFAVPPLSAATLSHALLSPLHSAHGPDSLGADHERVAARHTKAAADGGGGSAGAATVAPACDICKAADAVLLCCDDRALMCRG